MLQNNSNALTTTNASRTDRMLNGASGTTDFVSKVTENTGARRASWVAESDCAAIDVDELTVKSKLFLTAKQSKKHHGKGEKRRLPKQ